ncbi:integrase [Streptomyces goshikiensis]|uniref:integrase n=1 Tax=Streptomyces goshikiensis TaxID=1942 RepID=UPI0033DF4696
MSGALTRAELLALPATVDLETAGRAFGLKRSTTYTLAKRGELPVRTLRLGRALRVVTAELHQALGVRSQEEVGLRTDVGASAGALELSSSVQA